MLGITSQILKKRVIISFLIGILIFFGYWVYSWFDLDGYKGAITLTEQLNTIIRTGNTEEMKRVSDNNYTFTYIHNLSKNTKVENVSGPQGGSESRAYYVALLNQHPIDVWMHREKSFFGPKYSISNINVR